MMRNLYRPASLFLLLGLVLAAIPTTSPATLAAPNGPAPVNVQASECTFTTKVQVTWNRFPAVNSYRVWRSTSPTLPGSVIQSSTPNTVLDDTTAVANTRYYYRVQAYYFPIGWSGLSLAAMGIRTGSNPRPPIDVKASDGIHTDFVRVRWIGPEGADLYKVSRWRPPELPQTWEVDSSPFDDDTAACSYSYEYRIQVRDLCGQWSDYSSPDHGYREPSPPYLLGDPRASTCDYPDKVRLQWDSAKCATYYFVERHTEDDPHAPREEIFRGGGTSFDDTGVEPGRLYYYWFWAGNDAGYVGWRRSQASGRACPPPAKVRATDCKYPDKVRIAWFGVPNAVKYRIYRATSAGGAKTKIGEVVAPDASWDDTSADPGREYHYWLKTCFDSICTDVSDFSPADTGWACSEPPADPSRGYLPLVLR